MFMYVSGIDESMDSQLPLSERNCKCYHVSSVSDDGTLKYSEIRTFLQKQSDVASIYLSVTTSTNIIISLSASHLASMCSITFEMFVLTSGVSIS